MFWFVDFVCWEILVVFYLLILFVCFLLGILIIFVVVGRRYLLLKCDFWKVGKKFGLSFRDRRIEGVV